MDLDRQFQRAGRGRNGSLIFPASQTTTTLITATDSSHTIYVQRIIVTITTDAVQSISFQDSAGSPLVLEVVPTSPGANTRWDFYFGPKGVPLTKGANLTATFSAAGLAGHLEWNAYQTPKFTTAAAPFLF